ncbi:MULTISPECIES: beta-ketoacyl-[acyl-carrier-protein] synthase family protein [Brenneria]|uniref:Beta-ketoacyl-[acyl-carrier-protein] synthase family protein n=2 Tax=Brenneria nigrifluens TaxID=55210 RepID=A0A2U1UP59_9GAMM|nr:MULTISPECIES: beta-ketoacyl-[acyl-carrier-protein] synthase family protein [Brenneria]EHD23256.1 Beta-ketoacyl-acyl-carrier-protein synthase I [Brenneria sp. EniD312]PWC23446.1 beta-ketoacyl-[acyl-carrier-protein] synthase family protein [Brenneria nigrifluens DSM 30175 = ATCC 13028]QCR06189.1 beta-ketoacyl-[acyl-carrier-protein] synthase family protein [Brenneria nigrifluens DSM 30175 = ATCC 13028]
MVNHHSPVWVTGMAWSTALGDEIPTVWQHLLEGLSGITELDSTLSLRSNLASPIPDIPLEWEGAKRQHVLTVKTLRKALEDASIPANYPDIIPVLGTSYGHHLDSPDTLSLSEWSTQAVKAVGCIKPPVTVSTACSAGSDAILTGLNFIKAGLTEICVCGGADILTQGKRLSHSRLGTMSTDGLHAFDISHNGTVLGEGAAFLILESEEHAKRRGAKPYGVLAGAGSANDAASAVSPDLSGQNVMLTVERALNSAGLKSEDVSIINAHGTGTQVNDTVEAKAYSAFFASLPNPPTLFATKGAFGHTLGATGAIEAIVVLQALRTQRLPPIHGLREPISDLNLPIAPQNNIPCLATAGLSITLGFGGFNTCLVFQSAGSAAR